jgi:hypothetical protein
MVEISRTRSMGSEGRDMMLTRGIAVVAALLAASSPAWAQEDVARVREPDPAVSATAAGAFLPQTLSPRVGGVPAFAFASGGYDSSRGGPLVDSALEVNVWGPFALRAQTTYSNDTDRMRPSVAGRVQLLRQEKHGIDGSLTVFFKTEGFTETEGEVETFVSVGHRFEKISLMGDLVYGQDPEGNERDGEVRAAAFHQFKWLSLGLDSRVRFAIGTQHGRAATTEPVFDFMGGPIATAAAGPVAVFAQVGPSAFELNHDPAHIGLATLVGLGGAY